jgi:hypothetical protein
MQKNELVVFLNCNLKYKRFLVANLDINLYVINPNNRSALLITFYNQITKTERIEYTKRNSYK